MDRVVIDASVLADAFLGREGHKRQVIRDCLLGRLKPLIGEALFLEYEDVLNRDDLFRPCPLVKHERDELYYSFLSVCEWVEVFYSWRPNLADEADNHMVELAVAGGANIVTNLRDFHREELRFPGVRILSTIEATQEQP